MGGAGRAGLGFWGPDWRWGGGVGGERAGQGLDGAELEVVGAGFAVVRLGFAVGGQGLGGAELAVMGWWNDGISAGAGAGGRRRCPWTLVFLGGREHRRGDRCGRLVSRCGAERRWCRRS